MHGDTTLVVPKHVAPAVGLLPHSFRGVLSKLRIKTTPNVELTDHLSRTGVVAKTFLGMDALDRVISVRISAEAAKKLHQQIEEAVGGGDEEEEEVVEGGDNEEEEGEDEELYMELDEEETPLDGAQQPPSEEDEVPPLTPIHVHSAPPPPILHPAPTPLPQPPVLTLPTRGWTASDWAGKRFTLKHYDMGAALKKQLKQYRRYWLNSHVPNRKGKKLSSVTVEKRVERLTGFLGFLKLAKAVEDVRTLTLEAVLDDKAVVSFLDWLENTRSSSEGNRSEYLSAIISCVKFLYRDVAEQIKGVRCSRVVVVEKFKDVRNSLQSIASRKRKSKHELEEEGKWVGWEEEFLPMVEKQQAMYDACEGEQSKKSARLLHDLVLLRWQTVGPSRAGEIRTVEYLSWDELTRLRGRRSVGKWAKAQRRNLITKRPAGGREGEPETWTLYLAVYKTARFTGVDITEFDSELFPELCSALDVYLLGGDGEGPLRSLLNPLDAHRFVFMSSTGSSLSDKYFSSYLATVVERHTGSRPTASILRSSFITSMLDSEAGADMRNREAIAEQMRHSLQEQVRFIASEDRL